MRNKKGQFTNIDTYKVKLYVATILAFGNMGMFAIYSIPMLFEVLEPYYTIAPVNASYEPNLEPEREPTIAEHICLATNGENCDVLVNLAKCESGLNKEAVHVNTNGTVDLGIFQWNSVHYSKDDMSATCALDVYCSARRANEEIKKGHLNWWVCADKI